ncbi:glycerophosphodiester phosphodiesterase family protein [Providencia stuartii]|uniref:glycerophosphodiester phosphodiesterase family protein n=1 Tax=Providencia stuartii TaxID=588 RepID=UPI000C9C5254|nr:glycerophosphodiester phosphodiesterase family protein [Providencia stuartii]EMD1718989.1 glycerophosphodiester phosphodiesterase [Providencia stuartii]EMD1719693.1 glycerophosphodiester phosphodiesterase [Providencia stuartii]MBG5909654.1 glycerophosphodiester phosphodiesterase [Providencia stuartii]WAZ75749.1 glycerophosphodiester phosphodiesterase family protein [Providencia stuartii]HAU5733871.1 glycerophosphodiester phosphodiesterase [Providencia stuartii]
MTKTAMPSIKKGVAISLLFLASYSAAAQSPQIVAHRAGTADAPENTLYAIELAKKNSADIIWLTVQLSKDNQLVLYRPSQLEALTDKKGVISDYSAQQLTTFNAAHQFNKKAHFQLPLQQTTIPTLGSVLKKYPDTAFYIDLKSPDADPDTQAEAVYSLLEKNNAFKNTRFYSTNDAFVKALTKRSDKINTFESRDETRTILANSTMNHHCSISSDAQSKSRWYGFELHRKVEVVEKYTLGEARSPATLSWDKEAIDCFRKNGQAYIVLFGVNSAADYQLAKEIGADAVMVDSPKTFKSEIIK